MDSFTGQVARALWEKYGDEISSLYIIFPSRRARKFFGDELSRIVDRPVWEPVWMEVDELFHEISGMRGGDRVRLVTELYKVYSRYHDEPFDSFYFWGEMLLSDFDSVDKYLLDADMLFANVADLKALEADHGYLTDEQRQVVARFWNSFGERDSHSEQQRRFMEVWTTLAPIYHGFRAELAAQGLAYSGMAYRAAAERIKAGDAVSGERRRYVIAGFNALSECEKVLFDHLAKEHDVEFFWDWDHYYVDDEEQEAGLFLRDNMRRFPQKTELPYGYDGFSGRKNITVVAAPSDSMQCKYVADFLRESGAAGKRTAVVLTDENLLIPVLQAIPPEVAAVNVTMGYPLRQTLEYSFTERLIGLRQRAKTRGGRTVFYHEDVLGLLAHPFIAERTGDRATALAAEITARQQVYVAVPEDVMGIFAPLSQGWRALAEYLEKIISQIVGDPSTEPVRSEADRTRDDLTPPSAARRQRLEFFGIIAENIDKLANSLDGCGVELTARTFASLLRRVLQSERVPYEGEPLEGVQVMGILETRNIDFENVLLLSATDDNFPGNRAVAPSFIPFNLRLAYGLPTPQHHEGVYAYYFYRLLQRAKNVHIAYSSKADERSSGEQSRYIYQLEYESPHTLARREMSVDVSLAPREPIAVAKSAGVMERPGHCTLSPTAFYHFVQCPLKFYFHSVARLRTSEPVDEEVSAPMFGTILHRAMELVYSSHRDDPEGAVDRAIEIEYHKGDAADDRSGSLLLAREIVLKYLVNSILPFDARQSDMAVEELERPLSATVGGVDFRGVADRIDRLPDGRARIVDYKTGAPNIEFKGVGALFSPEPKDRNAAALQVLMYAMMYARETGRDVEPALYFVRGMYAPDYSPLLVDRTTGAAVTSYKEISEEFEARLSDTLAGLFDPARPFVQCADPAPCKLCDFNVICRR